MRAWRVVGVCVAVAAAGLLLAAGQSAQARRAPAVGAAVGDSRSVTVTDLAANDLGPNPVLSAGERVIIAARGFAPGVSVDVAATGTDRLPGAVHAGPSGVVRIVYTVPRTIGPGRHELIFVGTGRDDTGSAVPANRDAETISVVIPNLCRFDFSTAAAPPRHR